jgi:hypothetical protein
MVFGPIKLQIHDHPAVLNVNDEFQTWWNKRYFYTNSPLYEIFKRLHELGADLDYIDYLVGVLKRADLFTKAARKSAAKKNRARAFNNRFLEALKIYGTIVVGYTLAELRSSLDDSTISRTLAQRIKIAEDSWNAIDDILIPFIKNSKSQPSQKHKFSEETRRAISELPIFPLMVAYHQDVPKRGNQSDPWGTLFLLAVTEHLRRKAKKPHYREAIRLLRKSRGDGTKAPAQDAKTATVRVSNFKIAVPQWKEQLKLLVMEYEFERKPRSVISSGHAKN